MLSEYSRLLDCRRINLRIFLAFRILHQAFCAKSFGDSVRRIAGIEVRPILYFDILPMAEAGGFLDTDGICLRNHRSYDASPKKVDAPTFKMFIAAFLSRSCTVPQCGHVHSRTCKSFVAGFRAPQI